MIKILNSVQLSNTLDMPEDGKLFVEGYAMHFNTINKNREMVLPGAFDRFFQELKQNGLMPAMTAFHKGDLIVGKWTNLKCDDKGLFCEGFIDLNIKEVADNIAPMVKNGSLTSLSTEGFVNVGDIQEFEDHYVVKNMTLTAISLVPIGADLEAGIALKNMLENKEPEPESKNNLMLLFI